MTRIIEYAMKFQKMPKVMKSWRVPVDLYMKAKAKAAREGLTLTDVITAALARYLDE